MALLTGWHEYLSEGDGTWALMDMTETWSLPIGREAINRRAAMFEGDIAAYMTLMRLASFEGHEEAMWAICVTASRSTLDLFGLADRSMNANGPEKDDTVFMGGLRYILRGSDTSLMEIVRVADRWWADFRGERVQGRPPNSGAWTDADEFKDALRTAVKGLRKRGRVATQQEVTAYFCTRSGFPRCDDRQLRRWLARYDVTWQDFLASV